MYKLLKKLITSKKKRKEKSGRGKEIDLPDKMERSREEKKEKWEGKLKDRGKLFVGGLNCETTSQGLEEYFSMYGKVVDAVVMRFPDTGKSRGYGFVTFADSSVSDRMEGQVHTLDGHRINIRRFSSNAQKRKESRVFLGGVPSSITEDKLRDFFARYGEVEDVEIPRDWNTNERKGYAFVTFKDKNAADHCLLDRFVFLGGKRVHIEKAIPRCPGVRSSTSDSRANEEETEECATGYHAPDFCHGDDVESVIDSDSHSSASGDQSSSLEIIPGFQELIQDYFAKKMSLFNQEKVEDQNWEPRDNDLLEMEKLLTKLLINSGEEETPDLIDFSSDTASSDGDTTESEDDQEFIDDDEYDEGIQKSSPSLLTNPGRSSPANFCESLIRALKTVPEKPTKASKEISRDSDFVPFQRSSVPFKVNEASGSCNLCPWKSPDGSAESFLNHYKTAAHQMKLKERFLPEQTKPIDNGQRIQDFHGILFSSEKTFGTTEEGQRKKQCNIQCDKTNKKKEPDQKPQEGQQQKVKRMRQRKQKATQRETQSQENAGSSFTGRSKKNTSNLKVHALAKGMLCIQPLSGNNLSCKMCRKIIPKAQDFGTLMKNVSHHLQSKKHLNKLSETENSLKSALNSGKNSNQKNGEKAVEKKVQNPGQKIPKHGCTGVAKTGEAADSGKGKTNKKEANNSATADHQTKFLCLICNFFVNDSGKFTVHVNSKSHEETCKSKSVKMGDYATCKCCKRLLYGSLYDINKHHSKCLGKKNGA